MTTHHLQGHWRENTLESLGGVREAPTACVVRYGAFGDMIMASSVLPLLKAQGYRVCVNTEPRGMDILKMDPNVDEWFLQEKDQVDARELHEYWDYVSPMFQKWVNLTGSVEGRCLAQGPRVQQIGGKDRIFPPSADYHLPHDERHAKFDLNYLEVTHQLADVPFEHGPRFYATLPERRNARFLVDRMRNRGVDRVIAWVLSGSSTHKLYPYMDDAIKIILVSRPNTGIIFLGSETDAFLAQPWRDERRTTNRAGKLSIRDTMAVAQLADVVVGPETGVLNAVSMEENRKVVFLSHSSVENLTKHWRNTVSITSNAPCHPCHQLHLSIHECDLDPNTQMPICTSLDPVVVARAIVGDVVDRVIEPHESVDTVAV